MSARISIDLDDNPAATVEVTTGSQGSVWVKLREGHAGYEVWLTPAQALSLYHGLGDVILAQTMAANKAADPEPITRFPYTREVTS